MFYGCSTINKIQKAREMKKAIKLPSMFNPTTGKQSAQHTTFSEVSWGKPMCLYLKLINNKLDDTMMDSIMDKAKEFANHEKDEIQDNNDPDDHHANLSDGGEFESDDEQLDDNITLHSDEGSM